MYYMGLKTKMSTAQLILDAIRHIVRLVRESSRVSEDRVGLSAAQLFVLQKLDEKKPLSLTELAARTLTHQSSVSVVVKRLVDKGLMRRRVSPADARRIELLPTQRGLRLVSRAPETAQDRVIAATRMLSTKQRDALADALSALVRALGVSQDAAPMLFADEPRASAKRASAAKKRVRKRK
jgi:DNA-binding MarR family transcriptional regulator